jgi:hypothetical protein
LVAVAVVQVQMGVLAVQVVAVILDKRQELELLDKATMVVLAAHLAFRFHQAVVAVLVRLELLVIQVQVNLVLVALELLHQ